MSNPLPIDRVIAALDAIDAADPELAHYAADAVLLSALPDEVREAYGRLTERCRWWAYA